MAWLFHLVPLIRAADRLPHARIDEAAGAVIEPLEVRDSDGRVSLAPAVGNPTSRLKLRGADQSSASDSRMAMNMSNTPPPVSRFEAKTMVKPSRLTFGCWSPDAVLRDETGAPGPKEPSGAISLR
jgi:hypothetical protein